MCRYETAWEPFSDTRPPWCALFSEQDLALFEFAEDLKYYYHEGPGFEITSMMTQPLFQVKCADLNKHTFSLLNIEEKVYLFKSAPFISLSVH